MKTKKTFETGSALPVIAYHVNDKDILRRRIIDLEKEVIDLKNKLMDSEKLIIELLSYKKGLEKENRRIIKYNLPIELRRIDAEILSKL